jgi:hypothetical protein
MRRIVYNCGSKHRLVRFIKELSMREKVRLKITKPQGLNNEEGN